jgi:hypothetical protein
MMPEIKYLKPSGVHAVGVDLGALSASESQVFEMLEQFAAKASHHGLKCYAHGLASMSLITAAVCAGYDHLAGQAIAKPVDSLQGIRPISIQTMYLKRFKNIG